MKIINSSEVCENCGTKGVKRFGIKIGNKFTCRYCLQFAISKIEDMQREKDFAECLKKIRT
jgi:ribosomal protein L37AE/L43A